MPPDDTAGPDWSDAELDEWFENDFGGDSAFNDFYYDGGGHRLDPDLYPDLHFGLTAYRRLAYDDETESDGEREPWRVLSHEGKRRLRRGWEDSQAMTESVIGDLAPYDAMGTLVDARHELPPPKPPSPRWIFVGGGFGILGLVLMVGFVLNSGDDDTVAVPSETPVVETAAPNTEAVVVDTEAPTVAVEDEPAAVVVPEAHTIDVAGEEVDLTVWMASTATHVLVAAPSLNSNVDDLAGLAVTLAGQDCANVVAFDSSLTSADLPIFDEIIDKWLDGFGFDSAAGFSTLGSSATAVDALIAGINFGAVDVLVFSPSDPFDWESISPPIGITYATHVVARITTGDLQYRPVFDGWIEAELPTSFESYIVDGESHGTAFFNEAAAEPVLNEVTDHICHFVHDDFEFPEGFEQGDTSAWRR